ncbi:MAG TPA: twin-arginine translocation signal domain-containing protein [Terriglobales bacterium]|nr:twin-arginine translocation signal domain-containing protein [Terriglobales bacterium]
MNKGSLPANTSAEAVASQAENVSSHPQSGVPRRSFLKGVGMAGVALSTGAILADQLRADALHDPDKSGRLTKGDAAILRFLAAAEILETDLWLQYAELGGVQSDEVAKRASKNIPGYPAKATGGNTPYTQDLTQLDGDMPQYILDNTDDELSHEIFINAYLASKGADTVDMDRFRVLPSSKADGANQIGRLTNLMQLTVDTSFWTRYRSEGGNPDLGDNFRSVIPDLAKNQHPAIPRDNGDLTEPFLQVIANTAGFHFAFIEQGGSSLYPQLAQRVTHVEVLRILLSIGGTEITHFQTWHDKAGNAPVRLNVKDPKHPGIEVSFPNLNQPPAGFDLVETQTNLIMPEPTHLLSKSLPIVSIIRPTETKNAAMGAVNSFATDGLFIGQSKEFMEFLQDLAAEADAARRER